MNGYMYPHYIITINHANSLHIYNKTTTFNLNKQNYLSKHTNTFIYTAK
jgi:hypothetical protein